MVVRLPFDAFVALDVDAIVDVASCRCTIAAWDDNTKATRLILEKCMLKDMARR